MASHYSRSEGFLARVRSPPGVSWILAYPRSTCEHDAAKGNPVPRAARAALILAGMFLVLGLLVPYLVNVDHYRPRIVTEVESRTGRKLEIGRIRARLIPMVGFSIENVTLGAPAGFGEVNLLSAESITGSLSLRSLLHGELEITSVDIERPHVVLATDERGRTNYDFSSPGTGKKPAPAASSPSSFALDSLSIHDAEISLVDVHGQRALPASVKLSGIGAEFSQLDLSPGGLSRWKGEAPLSGVKLLLAGLPTTTFRSGEMKLENGAAKGQGEAELGDVARLKGEFSIPDLQKGVLNFALSTPLLDLGRLIAAAPSSAKAGESGAVGRSGSRRGTELLAKGKISAEKIRWAPYEATNASADLRSYGDRIEMPVSMSFYGGSLGINLHLNTASAAQPFTANVQASQVDLEKLLAADPSTRGRMTGHGELKMQLTGALAGNVMNSLAGQGNFALHNGTLPGVHLGKSMQELRTVEKVLSLGASGNMPGGETTFSLVQGDLDIHGARLYTNKTHLDTNMGTGDIRGSVGFDQTLDLAGTWNLPKGSRVGAATAGAAAATVLSGGLLAPVMLGGATGAALSVPFTVKGTLKDPKLIPGGGFPGFKGDSSSPSSQPSGTQPQQPQQKKKIFGIFPKP